MNSHKSKLTVLSKVIRPKDITCLNSSFVLWTDSGPEPTLPEGTDVKNGESPNMKPSSVEAGGERNTSTSEARANCGILVSSFVATRTVLESSGSI